MPSKLAKDGGIVPKAHQLLLARTPFRNATGESSAMNRLHTPRSGQAQVCLSRRPFNERALFCPILRSRRAWTPVNTAINLTVEKLSFQFLLRFAIRRRVAAAVHAEGLLSWASISKHPLR